MPPSFVSAYAPDDVAIARRLLGAASTSPEGEAAIKARARDFIAAIRAGGGGFGGVEEMLREYALSTREGLALMVLAEALLRVPDSGTADRLIEDKLGQGDFVRHESKSSALLVNASAWALGLSARIIRPGETPDSIIGQLAKRLGLPALRTATRQAMRVLGNHFVLGQTIEEALSRARSGSGGLYRYSFDMLGEGARTAGDAERYHASYAAAIDAIGRAAGNRPLPERPGISVKLSALHPRFEAVSRERVMRELVPLLIELARRAKGFDLNFTVDAEEADRLELSLDVIGAAFADPSLAGWDGFGLAIQAYQKRAGAVIAWTGELAASLDRRMMVRLVKGAYWDTEIKRAQERGLADYPVFTRKATTDLNFIACADQLLALRPRIFPQFASHNALTVATVLERAGRSGDFEFQRLHGMGETLYARLRETDPATACRVYAPVGGHRDLLAYLVRRLLENGANSSFVSAAADPDVPVETLLRHPGEILGKADNARHQGIPLPPQLYGPSRRNSAGAEFGDRVALEKLLADVAAAREPSVSAASLSNGKLLGGAGRPAITPIDARTAIGEITELDPAAAGEIMAAAQAGFAAWAATPPARRAAALDRAADLLEARRGRFVHLIQTEGGRTLDDAVSELREAVDFCRYYAAEGRKLFSDGQPLPGPTGESNTLRLRGRGVFLCISPWNFPLAIFTGQIAAALMAGNSVVAKPAEQTPLIAFEAVKLLHEAGVPQTALHLALGDGRVGAALVADPRVAGIAFTGSTEVARLINRALAAKDGPIVPLIAETGGINTMIADATALPEQVADDVVTSAFRSAGQRCSALRLLCVQEDVADRMIEMIAGAARELKLGDPRDPATQIGPVIDADAKAKLDAYLAEARTAGRILYAGETPAEGHFVAPHIVELADPRALKEEIFGPVLHVARWRAGGLDDVLAAIEATGYGLTLGIHSRITETADRIARRLGAGNVYVNRNMIGAVVGVQPFGGSGLSGTGPKAGGPHYLARFATEQVVTVNTAAAGGNAELLMGME
ncbi:MULTISPECIES: bifunctional proline dehydrogenase/L-glutamate gamma-semialdehyde dehydrogenase PutA [Rhodomicrobium]|nr:MULTISPECIES: bifunctional proline dehydrogenase/L-glutamate gamma-semialdehyde dehydrogenase PutA [Rhodomicrobium]